MDIYDYLKADHDKVADLFKQFEQSELPERKQQIVEMISHELMLHATSEQETFYVALEAHEETKEEADHGLHEHDEIESLIKKVRKARRLDAQWEKQVEKLKDIVEHHVKDEEGAMFKKAKKVLSESQAMALKEQMHDRKRVLQAEHDGWM